MTGWPYPRPPGISNDVDPNAYFDWRDTVISQYANSPRLYQLLSNIAGYIDQSVNVDALYDLVLNLDTAEGYGLDRWGRVVGINRVFQVAAQGFFGFAEASPGSLTFGDAQFSGLAPALGFAEAGSWASFGQGTFKRGPIFAGVNPNAGAGAFYAGGALTSNYALADQAYRLLILAKAAANITSGSIPALNGILLSLFPGQGNCYVQENFPPQYFGFAESRNAGPFGRASFYAGQPIPHMSITYVFDFPLTPVELAIVGTSGVLPKPVGVAATISVL